MLRKKLFISGDRDHSGLCGGFYGSCPENMNIRYYGKYPEPLSLVVVKERFFHELKNRKLGR